MYLNSTENYRLFPSTSLLESLSPKSADIQTPLSNLADASFQSRGDLSSKSFSPFPTTEHKADFSSFEIKPISSPSLELNLHSLAFRASNHARPIHHHHQSSLALNTSLEALPNFYEPQFQATSDHNPTFLSSTQNREIYTENHVHINYPDPLLDQKDFSVSSKTHHIEQPVQTQELDLEALLDLATRCAEKSAQVRKEEKQNAIPSQEVKLGLFHNLSDNGTADTSKYGSRKSSAETVDVEPKNPFYAKSLFSTNPNSDLNMNLVDTISPVNIISSPPIIQDDTLLPKARQDSLTHRHAHHRNASYDVRPHLNGYGTPRHGQHFTLDNHIWDQSFTDFLQIQTPNRTHSKDFKFSFEQNQPKQDDHVHSRMYGLDSFMSKKKMTMPNFLLEKIAQVNQNLGFHNKEFEDSINRHI